MGVIATNQIAQAYPQPTGAFNTPKIDRNEWARLSTYSVYVAAPTGAPTNYSLTAKWQVFIANTTHLVDEDSTGTWVDLIPDSNIAMFPDGEDWPIYLTKDATVVAPQMWIRRLSTPLPHRAVFTVAFTGGTSPTLPLTISHTLEEGSK